jgi:energy-coupling factor transporter ATP-binding protein EcfA2
MTLEEDIVEWAQEGPTWHRHVLRRLGQGDVFGADDFKELAGRLARGDEFEDSTFGLDDMPGAIGDARQVRLTEIREVSNVNALVPDQTLTIGLEGLTVVYGDNGSGKSGYARLVKLVVRARHREAILTNVFTERAGNAPMAELSVDVDGERLLAGWPDSPRPELAQISFFDAACGSAYVSTESEITYRPSALFVLDGLIQVCDGVRTELDSLLAKNAAEAGRVPDLEPGTHAAELLRRLSADTTTEQLDEACHLPQDADVQIRQLADEELRLRTTDPDRERARMRSVASKYQRVNDHMVLLAEQLSDDAGRDLKSKFDRAHATRAAAAIASAQSFDAEPLPGVGSQTWRLLWDAARTFSESECYDGRHFPVTGDGARCVLCHQDLGPTAAERLQRFDTFVGDHTQQESEAAQRELAAAITSLDQLQISPAEINLVLADLETDDPPLVGACRSAIEGASQRHEAMLLAVQGSQWRDLQVEPPDVPTDRLQAVAEQLHERASAVDSSVFAEQLDGVVSRRRDLDARRMLAAARDDVAREIERRKRRAPLETAKRTTDTSRITRKTTELTRAHVTSLVRDRFTRESDRLRLERVTLEDHGGQKGQLRHQPAFVGAMQRAALPQVLSEGEQTALGLAGFFTEVYFDASRSAVVLDDPVCSLDHVRREYVATRLAEFAQDRQVIVFTHDVSFVADLRKAADRVDIEFTERSVVRRGVEPGLCQESHPWKSKDVKARLAQLERELALLEQAAPSLDSEAYEKEASAWAGGLSETWERAINLDVVGKVVDRSTLEVRPRMFRVLACITETDDKEFQESYGRCSKWARRHDKSLEVNFVAPSVTEMKVELALVKSWHDRVRKYGQ